MADIIMVIARDVFRDEELFVTRDYLEQKGHNIVLAGSEKKICSGKLGGTAMPDKALKDVSADDFDAIVFVGGSGAKEFFDNKLAHELALNMYDKGKLVSAICIAPVILSRAGLLKGKSATVFPDGKDELIKGGAKYTNDNVTCDGNIITADGPDSSKAFAVMIDKELI